MDPIELEAKMRLHVEKWRAAKGRLSDVESDLVDIEINIRMGVCNAVFNDIEKGIFGALQPGDQTISDWAHLELKRNDRWLKLRAERTKLQTEIDEAWSEYEILKYYVLSIMSAAVSPEMKFQMAH